MRVLTFIFERFGALLLFFLLEIICVYLLVQFNDSQGAIWLSSANRISGYFHKTAKQAKDFVRLDEIADSLVQENARLKETLGRIKTTSITQIDTVQQDSLSQIYTYLSARVIKNSINQRNNFITIDKGKADGVRPHTGVITSKGVVGVVRKVGEKYALVMSILNTEAIVNAGIKRNGYFGPLVWRERDKNAQKMYLEDIPQHADVVKNDTVQTTGYSSLFPTGIHIGVIDSIKPLEGSNSQELRVHLLEDLANIQYVYVVNHLQKETIDNLEKELLDEQQ
ncbi:MAG: rod shape-determining protein MreC [Bacteroidota bacterium]